MAKSKAVSKKLNNFQIGEATESDDDLAPISAAATTAAAAAAKKKSKRTVAINLPAQANKRRSGDLGLSSTNPHHHQLHQDITDLEEDDHEGGHSHSKKQKTTATAAALVEITGKSSGKSARGSGGLVGADLHQVSSSSFAAASSGTTIEKALTFQMAKQLSIEVAKVQDSMMDLSKRFNTSLQKEAFTQAKVAYQDYIVSSESKFEEYESLVSTLQTQVDVLKGQMDEYKYNGYKPNEEMLIEINSLKAANKTLSEELQAVSETKRGLAMSLAEEVGRVDGLKKHIAEKEEELVFIDRELKSAESRYQAEMDEKLAKSSQEIAQLKYELENAPVYSGMSNKEVNTMQRLERSVKLYEKLTGLVIQSVNPSAAVDGREGAGDVEGETTDYACYYKGRDRSLKYTLTVPQEINTTYRCVYSPFSAQFDDMPSTHNLPDAQARQESLDLLPEYLHDEVEFISLEKFFERIYHWGINGLRPDMTKASPQPPQPPAPSHPSQPDQSVKQQQQLQVQQMHEEKGKEMDLDQAETQVEQMEEKNGEEMLVTIQQEIKEASSPALLTTIHREEEEAAVAVIGEEQHLQ